MHWSIYRNSLSEIGTAESSLKKNPHCVTLILVYIECINLAYIWHSNWRSWGTKLYCGGLLHCTWMTYLYSYKQSLDAFDLTQYVTRRCLFIWLPQNYLEKRFETWYNTAFIFSLRDSSLGRLAWISVRFYMTEPCRWGWSDLYRKRILLHVRNVPNSKLNFITYNVCFSESILVKQTLVGLSQIICSSVCN
jgi:hypothetical protein